MATILAAQCTDLKVDKVTADLFSKYNVPQDYRRQRIGAYSVRLWSCTVAISAKLDSRGAMIMR